MRLIGALINRLEIALRATALSLRVAGVLLAALICLGTLGVGLLIVDLVEQVNDWSEQAASYPGDFDYPDYLGLSEGYSGLASSGLGQTEGLLALIAGWPGILASLTLVYLAASTIATRELLLRVREVLNCDDLPRARELVAHLVGRDTAELDADGVRRAALETLAVGLAGAQIKWLRLRKKAAFRIDPVEFSAALANCDLAFLCNPNNPTGHALARKALREIADAAHRAGCVLVLDEAFADFCPESAILGRYHNSHLLILRSLTKFYGLLGLRIGFLAGPTRLLAKIKKHKEPWNVNILAIKAGCAALVDVDFRHRTIQFMATARPRLARELVRAAGGIAYPAAANYLFWEPPPKPL